MWHCSGTINGLNIDTDMERENKKKERERDKDTKQWLVAQMSPERAKSRPGQISCNDSYYSISLSFFPYFAKFKLGMLELAIQIFKTLSNTVKSSTEKVH